MSVPTNSESNLPGCNQQPSSAPAYWCAGLLLLLAAPLFVRMPLTNDVVLFDLQTRLFSEGDVPYRDILEPNWPGVFWIHGAARQMLGDRSEAIRLFDLTCLLALSWMIRCLALLAGATRRGAAWLCVAILAFYLGCSEWCHCQRDGWLLLPMAAATWLRMRRLHHEMTPWVSALAAVLEGVSWGAACWLKPYAAMIAVSVWLATQPKFSNWRRVVTDTGLVVIGGLLAGAGGVAWLVQVGAWPFWLETMRDWNPRYLAAGREHWVLPRFETMVWRMQPWYFLHLLAFPLALHEVLKSSRSTLSRLRREERVDTASVARAALAATYLATLAHVFLLQHLFDYVHAPAVLLAVVVVGTWLAQPERTRRWRLAILAFGLIAAIQSPLLKPQRVRLWWACVTQPSSAKLQDRLALLPNPHRVHLERVAEFLDQKKPAHDEVNILNSDLVGLYGRLGLRPPTRFVYLWELMLYFPQQRDEIMAELANSGHRYVVTDLVSCGMTPADAWEVGTDGPNAAPPKYRVRQRGTYPWSHPVVFRSGPYLVHEISGPLGKPGSPASLSAMKSLVRK